MKKTIVFKLRQFPHLSETFIIHQVIIAIKLGYDVKILVCELLDFNQSKQLDLIKKYKIYDKIVIEDYKIPKNKLQRFLKWYIILVLNISSLKFIIQFYKKQSKFSLTWLYQIHFYEKFRKNSIFHIQYGTNKYPVDTLKKIGFVKSKLIVSFHGHDAFFPINGHIVNDNYYGHLFSSADFIIANTPYLKNEILKLGCPKNILKVIPVGVDTDFFFLIKGKKIEDNQIKIITVGRLDPIKGHVYAIKAIEKLLKEGYNIEFTIVGEGNERINLENYILKNDLYKNIKLKGALSQTEVREQLQNHHLFLFTSVSLPDGRRETQGLATIEAQACGLPVIVFDSGGIKYTMKDGKTGFLCKEYDVNCLIIKIKTLMSNKSICEQMRLNAVKFVNEKYSQKSISKLWKNIYNE